ncbi:hypothetical protein H5410_041758 [Solanum commersonii]|uniref:Uncharacterized protein n=1 Tax=Solanum commersonii TaxID=4109 RepID=A0A9J5XVH6_SOLCO|nr:hypothetical protein H5410_041758 [Solanum commersonii]
MVLYRRSTDETKESKDEHNPTITSEHQTDEKTNIDNEQPIFCYIAHERRKKGTTTEVLTREFKCVSDEQMRRVEQGILTLKARVINRVLPEIDLNDEALSDVPGDQQYLKEVYIIQQFEKYAMEGPRILEKLRREDSRKQQNCTHTDSSIKITFSFIYFACS